jgi:pimeloyl-ACP methyl ester carboxylesterase
VRKDSLTLVLLPGLDGTGIMLEPFAEQLPAEWEPVIVRYPPDRCLGYDELVPRVRSLLPAGRPFLLVGESFGGPLAIRLAAEKPAGLCGLVLCATFATSSAPWLPPFCYGLVRPSTVFAWQVAGRFAQRLRGMCPKEVRRLFNRVRHQVSIDVLAHRVRETVAVNVTEELQQIAVPMLYLVAERDHVVPHRCLKQILHCRPDVEVCTIDAAHWILQTHAAEVVTRLRPFAEQCLARQDVLTA